MSITQDEQDLSKIAPPGESIGTVFQNNVKSIRQYVSRFFGSSQDVDDLLQDVFIRVIEAEKSTVIETPKAFIYKVARNLALNEKYRAGHKQKTYLDDAELEQLVTSISLEESIEQEQRFVHFCTSVNNLPPQCRKVFIMKKVQGMANADIATALNISISTVDKHLAKGLISCKSDLQRLGHFPHTNNASQVHALNPSSRKQTYPANCTTKNTISTAANNCQP